MINFVSVGSAISLLQSVAVNVSRASAMGGGIVLGIVSLFLGLLGILFVYLAVRIWRVGSNLRQHGMTVYGVITDRGTGTVAYTGPRSGGGRYYHVSYRYDCEGKIYSHRQYTSKKYYKALTEGTSVPVRCLANDPTVARVVDPQRGKVLPDAGKGEGVALALAFAFLAVFLVGMAILMAGLALTVILNR
jgi:hypothetical protein